MIQECHVYHTSFEGSYSDKKKALLQGAEIPTSKECHMLSLEHDITRKEAEASPL
uniref:Uncharacterized protein n=1 Tax=Anguilla anguilla TaxID=7936 RepID=A0A0E9R5S2_ANGAN